QLAGDTALLPVRVAAQRMLAAEAWGNRPLLEWVVQCRLRLEEIAHGEDERRDELLEEKRAGGLVQVHFIYLACDLIAWFLPASSTAEVVPDRVTDPAQEQEFGGQNAAPQERQFLARGAVAGCFL